jgi:hypothetical protein
VGTWYTSYLRNVEFLRDKESGVDPADPELKDLSKSLVPYPYNTRSPEKT